MNDSPGTALITGASRGIGAAIALGLAARGYDLALDDIECEAPVLRAVAERIVASGRRAEVLLADVSRKQEVERMGAAAIEALGHLGALVDNAGILIAGEVHPFRSPATSTP